ncbi:MAG: hypothetical protein K8S98_16195, partial [Planctomycetes bacterium]|nr:hypothetical protein [Planctomycetota bacterium]
MLHLRLETSSRARRALAGAAVVGLALCASADFAFPDFASTAGTTLVGAAAVNGARLALTPAVDGVAGGAWFDT